MRFLKKILLLAKLVFDADAANLLSIKEFGHINKNFLIIVCDPKTDRMFAMHKDRFTNGTIKSASGKNPHVVRQVLKYSRFNHSISDFTVSIMETLGLSLKHGNQFYKWIDGAIFKIGSSLRRKTETVPTPGNNVVAEEAQQPGAIPSPYSKVA